LYASEKQCQCFSIKIPEKAFPGNRETRFNCRLEKMQEIQTYKKEDGSHSMITIQ